MTIPSFDHPTMQTKSLPPFLLKSFSSSEIITKKKSVDLLSGGGLDVDALEVGLESVSLQKC